MADGRIYADEIVMDEKTRGQVDGLWDSLGLPKYPKRAK
jgi:hypothetical protein